MKRMAVRVWMTLGLAAMIGLVPASSAWAQQTQPGLPREILPDLGQIGAQVSLVLGASTNPFKANTGWMTGGQIDLPLARVGNGKLSYQIAVTNQNAKTEVTITSPLSAVGDLLAADGLGNTLTSKTLSSLKNMPATETMNILSVMPFGLKYTATAGRIRPYLVGAFGVYVTILDEDPHLTSDPRLAGAFIGGIAPEAIELSARGVPQGQGDIQFGFNAGAGVEARVASRGSLGAEYRFHRIQASANGAFSTITAKLAFHF